MKFVEWSRVLGAGRRRTVFSYSFVSWNVIGLHLSDLSCRLGWICELPVYIAFVIECTKRRSVEFYQSFIVFLACSSINVRCFSRQSVGRSVLVGLYKKQPPINCQLYIGVCMRARRSRVGLNSLLWWRPIDLSRSEASGPTSNRYGLN
jgi:hypothetical protein